MTRSLPTMRSTPTSSKASIRTPTTRRFNSLPPTPYDCVHAIIEAIDKAGIGYFTVRDGADIAATFAKGHAQASRCRGPDGRALRGDDEGQVEKPATAYVIQDGQVLHAA